MTYASMHTCIDSKLLRENTLTMTAFGRLTPASKPSLHAVWAKYGQLPHYFQQTAHAIYFVHVP